MRIAAAIASLVLAGCFYIDPINQRPSLDIRQDEVGDIFREEEVSFTAVVVDPDDHGVAVTWHVYLCTDATTFADCDTEASVTGDQPSLAFTVPRTRADGITPTKGMRIVLDGKDDHGATSKPNDQLQLEVKDRNPDLDLQRRSPYELAGPQFVVGMPIDIYAVYGDGDNRLEDLTVIRDVLSPTQVPIDITEVPIESPPGKQQVHWILKRQGVGEWAVEVTVRDPSANEVKKTEKMTVVADRAPCIGMVQPPIATSPQPVTEPRLFEVIGVDDDLDSVPRSMYGSLYGASTITWSILGPTGGRQIVQGTGTFNAQLPFDPDVYEPGTVVEIRVEIQDRKQTPVSCADGEATCAVGGNLACTQRQTWRVEAR